MGPGRSWGISGEGARVSSPLGIEATQHAIEACLHTRPSKSGLIQVSGVVLGTDPKYPSCYKMRKRSEKKLL